jgi:DNA-binding NtrC family response regulator
MKPATNHENHGMKLLLVDDQLDITRVLKEFIEPAGHKCRSCQNPRKALQHFKREHFDAVICDLRMPDLDGFQLLKAIREIKPATPVVILTGYADADSAASAFDRGAFAFLQKPVKLHELLEILSRIERSKQFPQTAGGAADMPYGENARYSRDLRIGING